MRVFVEYQNVGALPENSRKQLEAAVNAVASVLKTQLQVKLPVSGRLKAPPLCVKSAGSVCLEYYPDFITGQGSNACGLAKVNPNHVAGHYTCTAGSTEPGCGTFNGGRGNATDFYLYITSVNDEPCALGATAAWCVKQRQGARAATRPIPVDTCRPCSCCLRARRRCPAAVTSDSGRIVAVTDVAVWCAGCTMSPLPRPTPTHPRHSFHVSFRVIVRADAGRCLACSTSTRTGR